MSLMVSIILSIIFMRVPSKARIIVIGMEIINVIIKYSRLNIRDSIVYPNDIMR